MPNRSTGRNQTKSDPLVLQVRGLGWGLITRSHIKRNITETTETESRDNSLNLGYAGGTFPNNGEPMTQGGQSQQEAPKPMKPLLHPKRDTKIGNNMAPDCRERKSRGWMEIMGWGESGCCEQEKWRETADAICATKGGKETGTGTKKITESGRIWTHDLRVTSPLSSSKTMAVFMKNY